MRSEDLRRRDQGGSKVGISRVVLVLVLAVFLPQPSLHLLLFVD